MIISNVYKKLFENFTSLAFIRFIEFIVPLITFPYLVRVLGLNNYGIIQVAYYTKAVFLLITEFGFSLSAVRDISLLQKNEINESLNVLLSIKIALLIIALPFYLILFISIGKPNEYILYSFNFLHLIVLTLNPLWFFKARQEVKQFIIYILVINIVALILIFGLIDSDKDYVIHIIILFFTQLLLVIFTWFRIVKEYKYKFKFIELDVLKREVRKYFDIFLATLIASSYTRLIPLVINFLSNEIFVAIYVAAEKIVKAFENVIAVIHEALIPHFSISINKNRKMFSRELSVFTLIMFVICSISTLFLIIFSENIVTIVLGEQFTGSIDVLKILATLILIKGLGHISLIQIMVNKFMNRPVRLIVSYAAILSIGSGIFLIPKFNAIGAAFAAVLPEILVLCYSWIYVKIKNII